MVRPLCRAASSWRRLGTLLLLVGIVLSPLRAMAATVPMLIAYGAPLPLLTRLRAEFSFVAADEVEGRKQAQARADWIERAPPRVFLGRREEALRGAGRLRTLPQVDTMVIEFGDDAAYTKRLLVILGEPLQFAYSSKADEANSRPYVERCAHALDYDIVTF